jgi:hypothetical protein
MLLGLALVLPATSAHAQDDATAGDDVPRATPLTVNVELILDASSSMAEVIPGTEGQSRMDAAQVAMRDVIESIPEREGLNVGLRDCGHAANIGVDNSIAGIYANPHDGAIEGCIIRVAICFDESGQPNAYLEPAIASDELALDGTRPFSISAPLIAESCTNDLIAGQVSAADR